MKIGEHLPTFSLEDNKGNWFNSDEFIYKKYFVLFFFPFSFSPACTKHVCEFRNIKVDFDNLDAIILGINGQSVAWHERFASKNKLNYPLLTDNKRLLTKRLGIKKTLGLFSPRETFIFNKKGRLIKHIKGNKISLHITEALNAIKNDQKD